MKPGVFPVIRVNTEWKWSSLSGPRASSAWMRVWCLQLSSGIVNPNSERTNTSKHSDNDDSIDQKYRREEKRREEFVGEEICETHPGVKFPEGNTSSKRGKYRPLPLYKLAPSGSD